MPVVKITSSQKGSNTGSCSQLENYLQKENNDKSMDEKTQWYDQNRDNVNRMEVTNRIDNNVKGLCKDDEKFFMLTINYSQKEIAHISKLTSGNPQKEKELMQGYTRQVMETYAENFNKNLSSKDIMFFAIDEKQRKFKGEDLEVKNGVAKQGEFKPGRNDHTHVIISRKDMQMKIKLSPLTAHKNTQRGVVKGGFNRVAFKEKCELEFDKKFEYKRELEEKFEYLNAKSKGRDITEIKQRHEKEQKQKHNIDKSNNKELTR